MGVRCCVLYACSFGNRGRRGGGGGFSRGRGGFGGRGGKREFDRHSGSDKTGVKAVEKREGSGPHNWGDQIEAQMETAEAEPVVDTTEADTTTEQNDTPLVFSISLLST